MKVKMIEEIKEYCKILKLKGILEHFEEVSDETKEPGEYLHKLLMHEIEEKDKKMIECRIRSAQFPYRKTIEEIEMDYLPEPMQEKLPQIISLDFIKKGKNIILTGNPGTGKTHIAIGLGLKACKIGYKVLYITIPLLVTELKECNNVKKLRYFQNRFEKYDLVILDELGYVSFDREGTELLFTCLSLRTSKSIIITSNLTFERWTEIFGDPAVTSAVVDRLTYRASLIDMTGESYRFRQTLKENGGDYEYLINAQKQVRN